MEHNFGASFIIYLLIQKIIINCGSLVLLLEAEKALADVISAFNLRNVLPEREEKKYPPFCNLCQKSQYPFRKSQRKRLPFSQMITLADF